MLKILITLLVNCLKLVVKGTPFLSAVGGLNGGTAIQSTFFQIQAADNATVSSEPTKGQEGAAPTEYLGRDRVAYTFVNTSFP